MPDAHAAHLDIGAIIFPGIDQTDFTGPFAVLSRVSHSSFHVLWKERRPVIDLNGLILTPQKTFAEAPPLDVLVIPGGYGQEALMEDEEVLSFMRTQANGADIVFSVCTGALICGAAGLLRNVRATTHWASFHLLPYFGAIPVDARVVVDGRHVSAAGVTAGIDGALMVASRLRGRQEAESIQLALEYAPEPPFTSGTPKTASADILDEATTRMRALTASRLVTAKRIAERLGIEM